jgi:hypothetical protein
MQAAADQAQLDHGAVILDKARIRGAARGGKRRRRARFRRDGPPDKIGE